jgi:CDP-glycerol glycerophosphotransferase (TagB/SpsB family)
MIKKVIKSICNLLLSPLKYFPKKNIIILQTHSPFLYCDNTRFLYEYLSLNSTFDIYWATESNEIKNYLKCKNFKYISKKNLVHYILITIQAKIVIDTGDRYFNPFNLIGSKTLKITTYHGNGPKTTTTPFLTFNENLKEINKINAFDYINILSEYSAIRTHCNTYKVPRSKMIHLGYPRIEMYFDKNFVKRHYDEKPISQYLMNNQFKKGSKVILYTPTWRPYDYNFPLDNLVGFNYENFNQYLRQNNTYFFFSLHSAKLLQNIPSNLDHIITINSQEKNLYDTNLFMLEIDLLINDCATTMTDIILLDTPQIHVFPDLVKYEYYKGFVDNYLDIIPGPFIQNYNSLLETISEYISNPSVYSSQFKEKITEFSKKYLEYACPNSSEKFNQFILKITQDKAQH